MLERLSVQLHGRIIGYVNATNKKGGQLKERGNLLECPPLPAVVAYGCSSDYREEVVTECFAFTKFDDAR